MLVVGLKARADYHRGEQMKQVSLRERSAALWRRSCQGVLVGATLLVGLASAGTAQASTTQVRESGFAYDATSGLLTQEVVEPNQSNFRLQTDYTFDGFGNKVAVTVGGVGVTSRSNSVTFDTKGRFAVSRANELGHAETITYDERFGVPLTQTGPNGLTTSWAYDDFGRKTLETRADGTQTQWTYEYCSGVFGGTTTCVSGASYVLSEEVLAADGFTPLAPKSQTYYDNFDRSIASDTQGFDGTTIRKQVTYDDRGRKESESKPYFVGDTIYWTTIAYDVLSRTSSVTAPDGSITTTSFTALTSSIVNPLGQTQSVSKNVRGQEISRTDANGKLTTYLYDPFDNLVQTTDVAGNIIVNVFDGRGRKVGMDDPDMGHWTYSYNVLGELLSQTDAKGQTKTMTFDILGRMVSRSEPDLNSTWTYDTAPNGIGKMASTSTDAGFAKSVTYDAYGRPTQEATTILGETATFSTYYDTHGRVENIAYPTGFMVRQVYTSLGYLERVEDVSDNSVVWQTDLVDAEGHLVQETAGNGIQTTRVFDPAKGTVGTIKAGVAATVADFAYNFDSVGNLQQRDDFNEAVVETFQFDILNRLTQYAIAGGLTKNVTYDDMGNITSKSDVGSYTYSTSKPHQLASIAGTINTTYAYDANGNTLAGNGRTYTWNSFNKVITVTRGSNFATLEYDGDHSRMREVTNEETTVYFSGSGVRAEKATGTSGASVWKLYLFAGGRLIGQRIEGATTTTTSYFINDHLDSLAVITDEMGAVKERLAYDPWGKRRYADGSDDPTWSITSESNRGFTGQEQMDEVGLVNMNARLYDPEVGRFVSPDPYIQYVEDSQSYNRYAYARNNPLSITDPSGNFWFFVVAVATFAISQLDFVQDLIQANPILGSLIQIAFAASGNIAYAALGAAAVTSAQGGDLGDIIKSAAIAAATASAFKEIGLKYRAEKIGFAGKVLAHAAVGCASSVAAGGKCAAGAASAGFSAAAGAAFPKDWTFEEGLVPHAVVGGVAAELGGGKFANGAVTAAFGYIYNKWGSKNDGNCAKGQSSCGRASKTPLDIKGDGSGPMYVSGAGDQFIGGPVADAYYSANDEPNRVLFGWDQYDGIADHLAKYPGMPAIGHSYGASTLARLVADGYKVGDLRTVDPVGHVQPNFSNVAANSGSWTNYYSTSSSIFNSSNIVAWVGGQWGSVPNATNVSSPLDHANICGIHC